MRQGSVRRLIPELGTPRRWRVSFSPTRFCSDLLSPDLCPSSPAWNIINCRMNQWWPVLGFMLEPGRSYLLRLLFYHAYVCELYAKYNISELCLQAYVCFSPMYCILPSYRLARFIQSGYPRWFRLYRYGRGSWVTLGKPSLIHQQRTRTIHGTNYRYDLTYVYIVSFVRCNKPLLAAWAKIYCRRGFKRENCKLGGMRNGPN
jgi:hypothetical protein